MGEYKELFAIGISAVMGFYANRLTGKKDSRSGEQALIDKLFKEIERVDKRIDKLETENGALKVENYELKKENGVLKIENADLKTEIFTLREGVQQ